MTMPEAGLARNKTAAATSSGCPILPIGIMFLTKLKNAGSSSIGFVMGVSMKVGATEFTRMPLGASSTAMALVKPSSACLVMQ